ncbi:MAG TPA: peptidoglycan editing factor PgeF [Caulobacteraceae bacterium]|nr:peptidoglycan editing factor PgeF [Caulobacteraceae bacterium]
MAHLEVLTSPLLSALPGVRHGFFTRVGGVSEGIYVGLNAGPGSSDRASHVTENRKRAARWLGVEPERLLTAYQIHSASALMVAGPFDARPPEGDALVTRTKALALGALAADCAPVLIADPEASVVAAAHAGWKGALGGVVAAVVDAMVAMGAEPARMVAAVGPCIGPNSYEVGLDFLQRFSGASSAYERFFAPGVSGDKRQFDLPGFVLGRLSEAGVARAEWTGGDTYANGERFYSNRRALHRGEGDYGRLLSAILLTDGRE